MTRFKKFISAVLVLSIMLSVITVVATAQAAAELPAVTVDASTAEIVREIEAMRTEFSKTYLMSDDTYTTASYANPIHRLDENGEWQDIDNTLSDNGSKYVNENSNIDAEVSKKLTEGGTLSVDANDHEISWGFVDATESDAVVDNGADTADESDASADDALELENLVSRTLYSDIYSGVDAEYIINPNGVKENIILKNRSAQNEFLIKYNFDNLFVRLENSRAVQLLDVNGDLVYTISAPVMTDNSGNCSESLSFSIVQQSASSLTLKLTADRDWLDDAAYPVTIDPNITVNENNGMSVYCMNSSNGASTDSLLCGDKTVDGQTQKNYLVFNSNTVSTIPAESYVYNAYLNIPCAGFEGNFKAYNVGMPFFSSNTYQQFCSAMSEYEVDTFECDSANAVDAKLNITSIMRNIRFRGYITVAVDSGDNRFYYFPSNGSTLPQFVINYADRSGISDKYSYHTLDAGRAGTVYVNDLTQYMYAERTDFSFDSEGSSASASMVFSQKLGQATQNYEWRNIYAQKVIRKGSGTDVYYIWQNEHGETFTFSPRTVGDETHYIADKKGYRYYPTEHKITEQNDKVYQFENSDSTVVKLTEITEVVTNTNESPNGLTETSDNNTESVSVLVTVSYNTDGTIDTVTDSSNIYKYYYSESNVTVKGFAKEDTTLANPLDEVTYTYAGGKLCSVNYHGEVSGYTYTNNNRQLDTLTAPGGYRLSFTYTYFGTVQKVQEADVSQGTAVLGNYLEVSCNNGQTMYTDASGNSEYYVFDDNGNVMSITDGNGLAVNLKSDSDGNMLGSTEVTVPVVNLLTNSSFENGLDGWQNAYAESSTEKSYVGAKSVKAVGYTTIARNVTVEGGKTYTFSAYAMCQNIGNGYVEISASYTKNGNLVKKLGELAKSLPDEWQRMSVSIDVPEDISQLSVKIDTFGDTSEQSVVGEIYIDAVQLEQHKRAYSYNMIENADFETSGGWNYSGDASIVTNNDAIGGLGSKAVKFVGNGNNSAEMSQDIKINGQKGDSFTLSAWIKACGVKKAEQFSNGQRFAKIAVYELSNGNPVGNAYTTDIPVTAQGYWYKLADTVTLDSACDTLRIKFLFEKEYGVLFADGIELYSGGFAESQDNEEDEDNTTTETTTDSDGNTVETVKNPDGTVVSVTITDPNENVIYSEANGEITETTYTDNGSTTTTRKSGSTDIMTTTDRDKDGRETRYKDHENGVTKEYTYEGDEIASESTQIGGVKLKTLTSYSEANGRKTVISTDSAGNVTSVVTDALTGLTLSTTDGNNHTTKYTYDLLDNLTSLLDVDTNGKNTFTYENGNIKTITTNANGSKKVVYSFDYDGFGAVTAIKLGNVALVTYNYDNISHLPLTIAYANGNILTYTYSSNGELASLTGSSSLNEQYEYDEVGGLYKTIDVANGTVTMTAINGTVVVWNAAQTQVLHRYSADDKAFCEEINGTEYKTEFSSAEKTDDTQASTTVTVGGKTQTTYTDGFGRISEIITKNGSSVVMRQVYTYASRTVNGETMSSDQIESIATSVGSVTTTDRYVYDGNGNITFVYQKIGSGSEYILHKYEYDSRNQLTLSQDYTSDRMYQYTYSYDENGNINYEDYAVLYYDRASNSITGYVNGGRNEYSYNDSNWSDKVTYYKGAVSYDASGNPTSLDGATLQWENGRWLKSYSKGAVTSTYTYDSNGIRVSKYSSNSEVYTGENRDYTTVDGRITQEHIDGGGMGLAAYNYKIYYVYDQNGSPIGLNFDGQSYTYKKNIQGDIVGIISDSTRRRVVTYVYDAWGNLTDMYGTAAETVGKYNSLRYRGYYYDSETGYYYLQSRYYDPSYKRFINADDPKLITDLTKASVFGGNLFAYCGNNAINDSDPSGHISISDFWKYVNGLPIVKTVTNFAGFTWDRKQGIWYSNMYPIQRYLGYCDLFDTLAPLAGIIIKHKKIEFRYGGKKWMIWIWKGLYGITTGAEIGIYIFHARITINVFGKKYSQNWYRCAEDSERLPMSFTLYKNGKELFKRPMQTHWWLTGFKPGMSFWWDKLKMSIKIKFPNKSMAIAFCKAAKTRTKMNETSKGVIVSFGW